MGAFRDGAKLTAKPAHLCLSFSRSGFARSAKMYHVSQISEAVRQGNQTNEVGIIKQQPDFLNLKENQKPIDG